MKFDLNYQDYSDREVEQHSEDAYDYSWSEDHTYVYNYATVVTEGYSDVDLFPGEAEVRRGDDIYVVYVAYNTGDSFGRSQGYRVHLWAFSDRDRARSLVKLLEADAVANPDYDFDHKPVEFEGVPISTNDWKGYFEQFIAADIETVTVR